MYAIDVSTYMGSLLMWKGEENFMYNLDKVDKRVQLTPRIMEIYKMTACLQMECNVHVIDIKCIREEITVNK